MKQRLTGWFPQLPSPLALIALGSLTTSACQAGEDPQEAPASIQALGGMTAASGERPLIEKLHVSMLKAKHPQGNARLLATVSPHSKEAIGKGEFTISPSPTDRSRDITLNDRGRDGDDKPGDLVFTGIFKFDFDEFRQQNKRIKALGGPGKVSVVPFKGRLAGKAEPVRLIPDSALVPDTLLDATPLGLGENINVPASLVINDISVTQDPSRTFNRCTNTGTPMGAWTFGRLFQQMVNQPLTGANPSAVARDWLESWLVSQDTHFNLAAPRPDVQMTIDAWAAVSGGPQLDLARAPFRLVAIVNRMDLNTSIGYGGAAGSGGETRFVFALEDSNCNPRDFLVIFEYGNGTEGCDEIKELAQRWIALGEHQNLATYNDMLQDITDRVTLANASPSKPNGSALNQLRTNELAFAGPWQLREFILDPAGSGFLKPETVKRTPDISLNFSPQLAFAVDSNLPTVWPNPPASMPNILDGSFDPLEYPAGTPIRAMAAIVNLPNHCFKMNLAGNSAISARDARFEYSLNTCTGCHGGDANRAGHFTHIDKHGDLSPFLSGQYTQVDCQVTSTTRTFDEPTRRAQFLDAVANNSCGRLVALPHTLAEH